MVRVLDDVTYCLGPVRACFLGYAADPEIRERAASGGVVTALLDHLLESGRIRGALVSRMLVSGGSFTPRMSIVRTRAELLSCATSIYMDFSPAHGFELLREAEGPLAVVALPCQMSALARLCARHPDLAEKIFCRIGLFCGHTSKPELLHHVLRKQGLPLEGIEGLAFRKGHWRGRMHIDLRDRTVTIPFPRFGTYQNLFYLAPVRCLSCSDQTCEEADLSTGDAWLPELRQNPTKHSVIIARTEVGEAVVTEAIRDGVLTASPVGSDTVVRSQKRALVLKKRTLSARKRLAPLFRVRMADVEKQETRWHDYLSSLIVLTNFKLSQFRWGRRLIFAVPYRLQYLYFLAFCVTISL
jgi:coenzyme F420 hydrogenase subunit beta